MPILDLTTSKLQVVLGAAKTANDCPVTVDAVDTTSSAYTPVATFQNSNGTTAVDILAAPAASHYRKVNFLSVVNADTVPTTVTIRRNDNSTTYNVIVAVLLAGETLQFSDAGGWQSIDANGNIKIIGQLAPGSLIKSTAITGGTTFTTQPGTRTIRAYIQAGGGGGGGVASNAAGNGTAAGGGSAGGYAEWYVGVTGNTTYTVAIGAAGTAGASGGGTGGTGGNSTIAVNGTTVTANGGLGGVNLATGAVAAFALGGASPAVSTNGTVNCGGAPGGYASLAAAGAAGASGAGGSCLFGAGGNSVKTSSAGAAGVGYGAGGSGALSLASGSAAAGGAGLAGIILVDEFA